ncbi:hypothetical protein D3C71_2094220 [compost metagenome]
MSRSCNVHGCKDLYVTSQIPVLVECEIWLMLSRPSTFAVVILQVSFIYRLLINSTFRTRAGINAEPDVC